MTRRGSRKERTERGWIGFKRDSGEYIKVITTGWGNKTAFGKGITGRVVNKTAKQVIYIWVKSSGRGVVDVGDIDSRASVLDGINVRGADVGGVELSA